MAICEYVTSCKRCVLAKIPSQKIQTPMEGVTAREPLEMICIDFSVQESAPGGIEDVFSKFSIAVATRNQTAPTTAKVLVRQCFLRYGFPKKIHSDEQRNFDAKIIKEFYKMYGIEKTCTNPYSSQWNGQCECFNCTVHSLLRTLEPEQKRRWNDGMNILLQCNHTSCNWV